MALYKELVIAQIIPETQDTKTFVLVPLSAADHIEYKAGQFLTLVFPRKEDEDRRSFSISSTPGSGVSLSITVKRIDNGAYSRWLIDHAREGDRLLSIGASGFFTLPDDLKPYRQVFFFAAGSGITPVYALIKTLVQHSGIPAITLVYSNRSMANTIFYKELRDLEAAYPQLHIEFLFSSSVNLGRARLSKWLLEILLKEYSRAPYSQSLFFLCGPYEYMRMASIGLIAQGVPEQHIRKEDFVPLKLEPKELPPDTEAHTVVLNINGQEHRLPVQYPDTILKAAKKAGLPLPYSCEAGRCGTCVALCSAGRVWMSYNEVLVDSDLDKGLILTCTGYPVGGDVSLKI
ncbi:MAG: ferredoxin--NADP reductase [Chitinophagaceae bacterium]|nr:ferredoxin--NADP reductase [Chitinophagaceae bacterium]